MPEIVAASRLTAPTAYRVVNLLVSLGLLDRDGERRYREGSRMLELCFATVSAAAQRASRHQIMCALAEDLGENCHFCIQQGAEVVSVDHAESHHVLGLRIERGARLPLHCTAAGKMLLALMPASSRNELVATLKLERFASRTITDRDRLVAELVRIEREEHAISECEALEGVTALAVPVYARSGRLVGTLLVNAPMIRRSTAELKRFLPRMRKAAASLGATY